VEEMVEVEMEMVRAHRLLQELQILVAAEVEKSTLIVEMETEEVV
jgi:hypothetical protein